MVKQEQNRDRIRILIKFIRNKLCVLLTDIFKGFDLVYNTGSNKEYTQCNCFYINLCINFLGNKKKI